ncbi:MAG: rhamnan synthesis F family protein [Lachnospiraceae bacterium]
MDELKKNTSRCAIFLYYDRDGIVDKYVTYLLESLKPYISKLLIVCNGTLQPEESKKLEVLADDLLFRENVGFDVGGYREGLFYYGFQELGKYDEVILLNYTFFGPIFPFSEMFDAMAEKKIDFWGITRHYKVDPDPYGANRYGYLPEHIQSYFLVLRNQFFMSNDYKNFIFNLKNPTSYLESICDYETIFTKHFEDLGYKWDTYVDTSEYEGYAYCPVMFYIKDLIKNKRCPIIKRRSFFTDYQDYMLNSCGEPSLDMYEYVCDKIDYDVTMIWDNILRLENLTEISRVMHLNYILPTYAAVEEPKKQVAIFIILGSIKFCEEYKKYLSEIPEYIHVYLVGTLEDCEIVKEQIGNNVKEISTIESNKESYALQLGRIVSIAKESYEFAGVAFMRNMEEIGPYSNMFSWQYRDWENLFGTQCLIENVMATFKENERLGMLIPPVPNHGELFAIMADGWMGRFDAVKIALKNIGINANIKSQDEALAPVGGSFWFRTKSMPHDIINKIQGDMETVCICLPYLLQHEYFYTGISYSDKYAAIETTNLDYMMRETNKAVFEKYGPNYHTVDLQRIRDGEIITHQQLVDIPVVATGYKATIKKILKKCLPQRAFLYGKKVYFKLRKRELV